MVPADEAKMYHRMAEWYDRPEHDALRAAWGAYPATPGALQAWPGFGMNSIRLNRSHGSTPMATRRMGLLRTRSGVKIISGADPLNLKSCGIATPVSPFGTVASRISASLLIFYAAAGRGASGEGASLAVYEFTPRDGQLG